MYKQFVYIDSSEDENEPARPPRPQGHRHCLNAEMSVEEEYTQLVRKLLEDKIEQEEIKHFLTRVEDNTLDHNIHKRN